MVFALLQKLAALSSAGVPRGRFWSEFNPNPGFIGVTSGVCPFGDLSERDGIIDSVVRSHVWGTCGHSMALHAAGAPAVRSLRAEITFIMCASWQIPIVEDK